MKPREYKKFILPILMIILGGISTFLIISSENYIFGNNQIENEEQIQFKCEYNPFYLENLKTKTCSIKPNFFEILNNCEVN